jgi:hypothetical protein
LWRIHIASIECDVAREWRRVGRSTATCLWSG